MHERLKELHAPIYGDKRTCYTRLLEWERANKQRIDIAANLEARRAQVGISTDPVIPSPVVGPRPPSDSERALHGLTHVPKAAWCAHCIMGYGQDEPHRRVTFEDADRKEPLVCTDYAFLKTSRPGYRDHAALTQGH